MVTLRTKRYPVKTAAATTTRTRTRKAVAVAAGRGALMQGVFQRVSAPSWKRGERFGFFVYNFSFIVSCFDSVGVVLAKL